MKKLPLGIAALVVGAVVTIPRVGNAQVLNFEGIVSPANPTAPIGNFYNGGAGPNFGIEFSPNALAICLNTLVQTCSNGSRGGQGNPTSQGGALFFLEGSSTFINRVAGFTNGFSFFYSGINSGGSFSVFSGLNGTGTLLGSLSLPVTPSGPCPGYNASFCPFVAAGLSFAGTAQSITFAGVADQIALDDLTFGSSVPDTQPGTVPEPASIVLMGTGLSAIALVARRRRRQSKS